VGSREITGKYGKDTGILVTGRKAKWSFVQEPHVASKTEAQHRLGGKRRCRERKKKPEFEEKPHGARTDNGGDSNALDLIEVRTPEATKPIS